MGQKKSRIFGIANIRVFSIDTNIESYFFYDSLLDRELIAISGFKTHSFSCF
jgi:hypothetical protein